ncbi:O-antigen ligase family protein [Flavobacterium sasangense]|uniref:O-antigen ligase family protein n=1 Tax=Flavobacterium sasangense TaxID=503361 RepID=UPI00123769DA|nr:O-antigen ligase family protein [Flavobacterium sasangense]
MFLFLKAIVFIAAFTAFLHLFGIFILGDFRSNSIHELRGDFGLDNFIEIFALYILLFFKHFLGKPIVEDRRWYYVLVVVFLLSIYLYFSRTMLVAFFLVGFSMLGYAKITTGTLKFIGFAFLLIGLLYAYLFSVKIDRNAKGVEAFLYKIKIAPEEIFETKIDRENHKELWDHWRGYEAKRALELMNENPTSYFFGTGYGSLINLKFKAPVGEQDMKYISRIHNGYVFVLYKTGFVGLILYFIFLIKLYLKIYTKKKSEEAYFVDRIIVSIGVFYVFTSLIITGIYIPIDAVIFILGGLLSFDTLLVNKKT